MRFIYFFFFLLLLGCSDYEKLEKNDVRQRNCKGDYIYRKQDSKLFPLLDPKLSPLPIYPWENENSSLLKITKEYFRCKGSPLHPSKNIRENQEEKVFTDCEGNQKHSLPLVHGKEGVYPILLDLLNYVQKKTARKVVVTCGHRCPVHNTYADRSKDNRISKHMIGAEVDFYVQGLENKPEEIVEILQSYYKDKNDYEHFYRYDKSSNASTKPWFNKEVFIKLYQKNEGRDFDNRHPYPYIAIQVRYDRDIKDRVIYTWEKSVNGYLRW